LAAAVFIIFCEQEGFFFANDLVDFIEAVDGYSPINALGYWIEPKLAIISLKANVDMSWLNAFI